MEPTNNIELNFPGLPANILSLITDMEIEPSTAATSNNSSMTLNNDNTAHSPLLSGVPSMSTSQRSASTTHTSIRVVPYSRETYHKLCSHSKLFGTAVLMETSCSHVECWDRGHHLKNAIHIPIREGDPYQVGDVLDAVHARGCEILRYDVFPWRFAENADIIEIVGRAAWGGSSNSDTRCAKKTVPKAFSPHISHSEHDTTDSVESSDAGDFDYGEEDEEEEEEESDENEKEDDDAKNKPTTGGKDGGGATGTKDTTFGQQQSSQQPQHCRRKLSELVVDGIQVLGHPVQVLRPKDRFDQLWRVKVRGWEADRPLFELYTGLKNSLGPKRHVIELESMGVKTKRAFWPSGDVYMYIRTLTNDTQPKRTVIPGLAGMNTTITLTWLTCLERCPGGLKH